jgi:pyruvate-formate lyase-activating enzyme
MPAAPYAHTARPIPDEAGTESGLVFDLDYPSASQPLYSNVNFVSGHCFHQDAPVERVKLSLNGREQSAAILGYPRADVSRRYPKFGDRSLLSGFNGFFDSSLLSTGENRFDFQIRAAGQETNITKAYIVDRVGKLHIADVFVDIVGPCNLRCAMCPQGVLERRATERGGGFMSVELFERVVSYLLAQGYSGQYLNLYNWGDPLLHPSIGQILDICHASGLKAVVSTNLSFSTARIQKLARHPIDLLLVSVSGFSPETYVRNHVGGRFALIRQNLEALRANRGQIRQVVLKYLLFRYNCHEVAAAKAFCDDAGLNSACIPGQSLRPKASSDTAPTRIIAGKSNLIWRPRPLRSIPFNSARRKRSSRSTIAPSSSVAACLGETASAPRCFKPIFANIWSKSLRASFAAAACRADIPITSISGLCGRRSSEPWRIRVR